MIAAVICAGGIGSRMGRADIPKQYIEIGKKPIIIRTIENFVAFSKIDEILVLCPGSWVSYTENLVERFCEKSSRVKVLEGGETRNETIRKAISYLDETHVLSDRDILITHDAARPFLTERVIRENIEMVEKVGACNTVIPATDTILESLDGINISAIPERQFMYQTQTPQSFRTKRLRELYDSLSVEEKDSLTDAAKIYVLKNEPIQLVRGENFNIKITYPHDLLVAEAILKMKNEKNTVEA